MDQAISSIDRQQQIHQLISRQQRLSVVDICETFNVSESTARRDLDSLAKQGKLQRVHGGAIASIQAPPEKPFLQRQKLQAKGKMGIGRLAASLVKDGETVFLGSGSTVMEVARVLCKRSNITIVTNSLPVINLIADSPAIDGIFLGGMFRKSELSFIGHITEQALSELYTDKVFIGTRAISLEHGLTNEYPQETMTDRAIVKSGKEIILVADHTKFGRTSTVLLLPLDKIDKIVTDVETPPELVSDIEKRGIEVLIA